MNVLKVLAVRSLSVRASDLHGRKAANVKMTNASTSVPSSHEFDFLSHPVVKVAVAGRVVRNITADVDRIVRWGFLKEPVLIPLPPIRNGEMKLVVSPAHRDRSLCRCSLRVRHCREGEQKAACEASEEAHFS
jgi:hypothetical protein